MTRPCAVPATGWAVPLAAGLLLAIAEDGPDFGHYADWAAAALTGDIFQLRGNVLSPGGVPFSLAASGTGLLFAIGKAVLLPLPFGVAAHVAGWIAAIVFWACSWLVFDRLADGDRWLTLFGAGALFIGTHAGLYSHAYATEVFANALVAALWALALTRERSATIDAMVTGALAGLLLLVRAHVVLYAIPAMWVVLGGHTAAFRRGDEPAAFAPEALRRASPEPWRRREGSPLRNRARRVISRAIAMGIPIAIAGTEYALVNRWMTGSLLHAPYVYGGAGFTSVDLTHPQFAAVLAHPWHGLLAYHPLYAVAFVAVVLAAWRVIAHREFWMATALAAIVHLWVQAGWYIWWLGGSTFGMRGMAPAALPLVAGLVAWIHHESVRRPHVARMWLRIALVACAWSFPLLLRGNTDYVTWGPLLRTVAPGLAGLAAIVIAAALRGRRSPLTLADECRAIAILLLIAAGAYLLLQFAPFAGVGGRVVMGIGGAVVIAGAARLRVRRSLGEGGKPDTTRGADRLLAYCVLVLFIAQAALFGRLAARTERHIASGAPPPRTFAYLGTSPIDELRVTYNEYLGVPGFEAEKARFRRFLAWQRVDSTPMAPRDREIARQVIAAWAADPALSGILIEATADDGEVRVVGHDMSDAQESRARAIAARVPGVRTVVVLPG